MTENIGGDELFARESGPLRDWDVFETALARHLQGMQEGDFLIVELPFGGDDEGAAPYAQFCCGPDHALRSEMASNAWLVAPFRLTREQNAAFRALGWKREVGEDRRRLNFVDERPTWESFPLARQVVAGLRDIYGIAHPELLTYRAWGPSGDTAELGLVCTHGIPAEQTPTKATRPRRTPLARMPADHDELVRLVKEALAERIEGGEVEQDADGDFPLQQDGLSIWVRVRPEQPAVEIMTCVVHEVRSRRRTAIELGLLNRDYLWCKWTLRERTVWQQVLVPAAPFAPKQLLGMVDGFFEVLAATRDDLALRTLGKVA